MDYSLILIECNTYGALKLVCTYEKECLLWVEDGFKGVFLGFEDVLMVLFGKCFLMFSKEEMTHIL